MQTKQSTNEGKRKVRKGIRIAVFIGLLAALYFLHDWLAANSATVSDQAIVYLTVVLVFVSYLQWDVMLEQNAVIERQLDQVEFQQRAWLAASVGQIAPIVPKNEQIGADIDWKVVVRNTGSTPGIIACSSVDHKVRAIDEKKPVLKDIELWAEHSDKRRTVVAPGAEIIFPLKDGGGAYVSRDDAIAVTSGGRELYLMAAFFYKDVFGGKHKTTCIFKYNRDSGQLDNSHQDGEMT